MAQEIQIYYRKTKRLAKKNNTKKKKKKKKLGDRAQKFRNWIGQVKYKQNEVSHDIFDHVTRQVTR